MSHGPRSPGRLWVATAVAAATLVAAASGWFLYRQQVRSRSVASLRPSAREELAALVVPARATAVVERGWVADGFRNEILIAPVGPLPCTAAAEAVPPADRAVIREALAIQSEGDPEVRIERLAVIADTHPGNLLVAQLLGTELIHAGRHPEAERVITRALDGTNNDESIIAAARVSATLDLDDLAVSNVIHLHHALGVARLSQSASEPPWKSLKNVIGSVKPLSRRRLMGTTRGQSVASRLLIAAPGCPAAGGPQQPLSSYDLFNNLIAGYMRGKFTGTSSLRDREFARPAKSYPSALHRLFVAQVKREAASGWANEAQLWALSNVEQVLDWRMPDDARLALSAVHVIDWWTEASRCPAEVCTPELVAGLATTRNELLERAIKSPNVAPEQRNAFARGITGLLATSTLDRSRVAPSAGPIREWLPANERRTLDDLLVADAARHELPRSIFAQSEEPAEPQYLKLGSRAATWHAAALTDVAAVASRWAATQPPPIRRDALVAIRQMLGSSEAPPELRELEQKFGTIERSWLRLQASRWFWAAVSVFAGLCLWLALMWIIAQVYEARLLRVSYYTVELEYLAAHGEGEEKR